MNAILGLNTKDVANDKRKGVHTDPLFFTILPR